MKISIGGTSREIPGDYPNLRELLLHLGAAIPSPCGGNGRCGKCRVILSHAEEPTAVEKLLLSEEELAHGVRLACVTAPFEGMEVSVESGGEAYIALDGQSVDYPFDPPVQLVDVMLPEPGLADQRADRERLSGALGRELTTSASVLASLPETLRASDWNLSVVLMGNKILGIHPRGVYGVAVDVGTTTLAAYLIDLSTGRELAAASALNPQRAFGDDVISRADHARAGGLEELQQAVVAEVNRLTTRMCVETNIDPMDVFHMVFTGNTVMMHLLAGVTPRYIAQSPFIPVWTGDTEFDAVDIGMNINPEAVATILPCVSGYIGADTVAALIAAGIKESGETALLIDIGTNGEIALAAGGAIYACSTAAGPAFEGAHISCGMGSVSGAIKKATLKDGIRYETIGDTPAKGICGSGLLDLIAGFLDCGAIDETGRIDEAHAPQWLQFCEGRLVVDATAGIYLAQRDVREVQLAKGAIAAGMQVLLRKAGIAPADIRRVFLAGGFGSDMDRRSACRVGLLPPELQDRARSIGNGSGAGAKAVLRSAAAMREAARLAATIQYIELSACREFQDLFAEAMLFS